MIARENLASQEETLRITEWRDAGEPATSLEAERARTAVEQTRAQVPALQTTIAQVAPPARAADRPHRRPSSLPEGGEVPQPATISRSPSRPIRCASAPTCAPPRAIARRRSSVVQAEGGALPQLQP